MRQSNVNSASCLPPQASHPDGADQSPPGLVPIDYASADSVKGATCRKTPILVFDVVLLVVFGLGLYLAIFHPFAADRAGDSKRAAVKQELLSLKRAIEWFKQDVGRYPSTKEGLAALCVQPPGLNRWQGPYVSRDMDKDPWGNPYIYRCPGVRNRVSFDLLSTGADGREGTRDDVWAP